VYYPKTPAKIKLAKESWYRTAGKEQLVKQSRERSVRQKSKKHRCKTMNVTGLGGGGASHSRASKFRPQSFEEKALL
jgi:hypothetical protein